MDTRPPSPRTTVSTFSGQRLEARSFEIAMSVGVPGDITLAFKGVRPFESSTIRRGLRGLLTYFSFTRRLGSSDNTVPIPTRMASERLRSLWTLAMSSSEDILVWRREGRDILPSADMAQLTVTSGGMDVVNLFGGISYIPNDLEARSCQQNWPAPFQPLAGKGRAIGVCILYIQT
jgi:hypothetical protein